MDVGGRITYFRKAKNYTVNKLANTSGISQSYLRDIENGNKNPTIAVISTICDTLGISLKEFFDEEDTGSFTNSELMQTIYQMSLEQQNSLKIFLQAILPELSVKTILNTTQAAEESILFTSKDK